jgi:hypothetical protein
VSFVKILNFIAGIDDKIMNQSPGVDRLWATQLGISLIIAFCFVSSISYYSLGYFLHSEPAKITIAILIASVVSLFDRALFQSDWFYMGLVTQLRDRLQSEQSSADKLWIIGRQSLRIFFRLGISLLIAYTLSLFVETAVFGDAITEKIEAKFLLENAEYYKKLQEQSKSVDLKVIAAETRTNTINQQLNNREQRIQSVMNDDDRRIYDGSWESIKAKQAQIESISARIAQNDQSIRTWNDDIQAEINGVKLKPEHTGLPSCGPMCLTKKGMVENAAKEKAALKHEQTNYEKEIQDLQNRTVAIAEKYERADKDFVEERKHERDALQQQLEALRAGRTKQWDETERELKKSGIFHDRRDDPIIRVGYLKQLKKDPERGDVVSEISWMIKLFIMFLEIAPVVGKMFFAPPSAYAWKIQTEVGKQQLAVLSNLDSDIQQHITDTEILDKLVEERRERMERNKIWAAARDSFFDKKEREQQAGASGVDT